MVPSARRRASTTSDLTVTCIRRRLITSEHMFSHEVSVKALGGGEEEKEEEEEEKGEWKRSCCNTIMKELHETCS